VAELLGVRHREAHALLRITDERRRRVVVADGSDFHEVRVRLGYNFIPRIDVGHVRRIAAGPGTGSIEPAISARVRDLPDLVAVAQSVHRIYEKCRGHGDPRTVPVPLAAERRTIPRSFVQRVVDGKLGGKPRLAVEAGQHGAADVCRSVGAVGWRTGERRAPGGKRGESGEHDYNSSSPRRKLRVGWGGGAVFDSGWL